MLNHNFTQDQRGTIAIVFALTLTIAVGVTGTAVDYARALSSQTAMQSAADAAATSAASLVKGTDAEKTALAAGIFSANYNTGKHVPAVPSVSISGKNVTVTATAAVPTTLAAVLGVSTIQINGSAAAEPVEGSGDYVCMLALNATKSGALKFAGSRVLSATDCAIRVNSNANDAISGVGGSYRANAKSFCAVGVGQNVNNLTPPMTNCEAMDDPYANFVPPAVGGCTYTNLTLNSGSHSLAPGVYCGGLTLRAGANVTLQAGTHVIKDGAFQTRSGSKVTGNRVTLHLTGVGAVLDIRGGTTIDVKAPKSGDFAGFAIYQDADSNPGSNSFIQGGGMVTLEGVLYMPTHTVELSGNGDVNTNAKMWVMVADSFDFSGDGSFLVKPDNNGADLPDITPTVDVQTVLMN